MRKIIAALNMTIDGICDHTAGIPDEEIHQHYTELLGRGDAILYGRTTYQLIACHCESPPQKLWYKSINDINTAASALAESQIYHQPGAALRERYQ